MTINKRIPPPHPARIASMVQVLFSEKFWMDSSWFLRYRALLSEKPTGERVIIIQPTVWEATHADVSLSDRGSYLQATGVVQLMRGGATVKDLCWSWVLHTCLSRSLHADLFQHAWGFFFCIVVVKLDKRVWFREITRLAWMASHLYTHRLEWIYHVTLIRNDIRTTGH